MKEYGKLVGKVLVLLAQGTMLGLSRDKGLRLEILKDADRTWHEIDRKLLYQILKRLKLGHHIEFLKTRNGIEFARLTAKGKERFLQHQFNILALPRAKRWDGKWRIVLFDIPEPKKKIRDSLRRKLKALGFLEFQKSVFIYPFPCRDEINFVINFYIIPEPKKKIRDSLRRKLKALGFLEFQKSVFIYPFPCRDEINFVINFYNIPEYVYYLEAPLVPDGGFRKEFDI